MAINVVTEETLPQHIAFWQRFLCLKDWKIEGKIVDEGYFDDPMHIGRCDFWIEERCAIVAIANLDMGDRVLKGCVHTPFYDMEATLIHEMLHVFFAPLEADEANIFLEQRVNVMTERLMECRYWIKSCFNVQDKAVLAQSAPLTKEVAAS